MSYCLLLDDYEFRILFQLEPSILNISPPLSLSTNTKSTKIFSPLKTQLQTATSEIIKVQETVQQQITLLTQLDEEWNNKLKLMEAYAAKVKDTVRIDVGGRIFKTTKETLLSKKYTFFHTMLSSGKFLPDDDGLYFIDRNPKLFGYVLDYLRYGKVDLSELTTQQRNQLAQEADFYLVPDERSQ